jgi:peptide subunit release factor 1 (eRF1)
MEISLKLLLRREELSTIQYKDPEITYTMMNMRDPVIGGFSPEKSRFVEQLLCHTIKKKAYNKLIKVRLLEHKCLYLKV